MAVRSPKIENRRRRLANRKSGSVRDSANDRGKMKSGVTSSGHNASTANQPMFLPTLIKGNRYGIGVVVAIVECQGKEKSVEICRLETFVRKPGLRPKSAIVNRIDPAIVARMAGGLAQYDRVRLAKAILTGAHSHAQLSKAVGLRPGPLYHHLRALERSGLVTSAGRNTYELTPVGRAALLASTVIAVRFKGHR